MEYYNKITTQSILRWKIDFPPVENLKLFKEWLKIIEINIVYDFQKRAESDLQVSKYKQFYRV